MKEIVKKLESSPLFQLSLSSKELFHSNFLYWLCSSYPEKFGQLFLYEINESKSTKFPEIKHVLREKNQIDLTLILADESKIILENKVKSIPNQEQLVKYKEKNIAKSYILLSLMKPHFEPEKIGWLFISYAQLNKIIIEFIQVLNQEKANSISDYHVRLLKDYTNFISCLVKLSKRFEFKIAERNYDFYGEDCQILRSIRLHDIYLKYNYHQLSREIVKFLKNYIPNTSIYLGKRYDPSNDKGKLVVSTTLVNGKGVINIDYTIEDEIIYGIMLDGMKYDHYIYSWGEKGKEIHRIGESLKQDGSWFTFDFIKDVESYPRRNRRFNRYGNHLIYRYAKLTSDLPLSMLLTYIGNDVKKMKRIRTGANNGYDDHAPSSHGA